MSVPASTPLTPRVESIVCPGCNARQSSAAMPTTTTTVGAGSSMPAGPLVELFLSTAASSRCGCGTLLTSGQGGRRAHLQLVTR